MKTLTDVKRRLTAGTILVMTWHRCINEITVHEDLGASDLREKLGIGVRRKIVKVQSLHISFQREDKPDGDESWLKLPRASELRIDGPHSFTVLRHKKPFISYTFVS